VSATPPGSPPARLLPAAFLAAGLAATAGQVLLLRELVVDGAGDEAGIGVGLAAWLLGIALGAVTARRLGPEARRARRRGARRAPRVGAGRDPRRKAPRGAPRPPAGELPGLGGRS